MGMQRTRDRRTHGRAYSENLKKKVHFDRHRWQNIIKTDHKNAVWKSLIVYMAKYCVIFNTVVDFLVT